MFTVCEANGAHTIFTTFLEPFELRNQTVDYEFFVPSDSGAIRDHICTTQDP